jgi:hypothetical protein
VAVIVFLVLAANASLIVLSFQALTESLTVFLLSLWILGLSAARLPPARPRDALMLVLPLALLTVVRPQFEVELLIALVLMAIVILRLARGRARLTLAVAACCVPVVFQVGLMTAANHTVAISSSGETEFKGYFVSQVYARLNGLPDDLVAARSAVSGWSDVHAARYLADHPRATVSTFVGNFHGNLTSGSNFVDPAQAPTLADAIRTTNRMYLRLHILFLPIVLLALWRRRDARLLLLYVFAGLVTVLPSLIADQGDRYVEVALPLWAAAYGLAVSDLIPEVARVFAGRERQPRPA